MIDLPVGRVEYTNKNASGGKCVRPANMSASARLCHGGHSFLDSLFLSQPTGCDSRKSRRARQGATSVPYESGRRSR